MVVCVVAAVMEYSRLLVAQLLNAQLLSCAAASCQALNHLGYPEGVSTSDTRWLSAGEQQAWREFLTACQTLFSAIDWQLQHDAAIPHGYYEILVRLSETPGRALRMSQLADEGFDALAAAAPGHVGQVRRSLIDVLTPEQLGQLQEISSAIVAAADQ